MVFNLQLKMRAGGMKPRKKVRVSESQSIDNSQSHETAAVDTETKSSAAQESHDRVGSQDRVGSHDHEGLCYTVTPDMGSNCTDIYWRTTIVCICV